MCVSNISYISACLLGKKLSWNPLAYIFLLLACSLPAPGQTPGTGRIDTRELHGGIEIAPRVVRVIALRISNAEEGFNVKILYSNSATLSVPYPGDGKLTPEYTRDVAQTVQSLSEKLQKDYQIPLSQIYIISLSDLAPQNPDDLMKEVRDRTGKTMNFLNSEAEIQLSIAGIIPRRYKSGDRWYDNRGISSLIDIGNTTTKGGYQQLRQTVSGRPDYDYAIWSVPKGTVTFVSEVNKAAGENADYKTYAKRAEAQSSTFRSQIRAEIARKPGIMTRRKVYLTGGIVWAMVTLLHPEDQRSYIPITMDDIDTFYNRAVTDPESLLNPDLSKIRDENLRNEIRRSREAVKQAYSPKTLIAGAELLKTLVTELNPEEKRMLYPRYSYLARILSYVRLQPE